jgi:hypothetical protein
MIRIKNMNFQDLRTEITDKASSQIFADKHNYLRNTALSFPNNQ